VLLVLVLWLVGCAEVITDGGEFSEGGDGEVAMDASADPVDGPPVCIPRPGLDPLLLPRCCTLGLARCLPAALVPGLVREFPQRAEVRHLAAVIAWRQLGEFCDYFNPSGSITRNCLTNNIGCIEYCYGHLIMNRG
jgi:hypothetical protein